MRRAIAVVVVTALALVGCSSTDTAPAASSGSAAAAAGRPAAFTGDVDAFYDPPEPLTPARPGTLIRYQPVGETPKERTWRIMYHSIDAAGRDQPVTALVTFPRATAPPGGWPVVSSAPGTVGLNTSCALSRRDDRPDDFGVEGVSVRTDYIGMVQGQVQRYLSGVSEAHSVIDAVRAVRNIAEAHAGARWVAFGHSQGGHAALFTNELARAYAPELDLEGAVVGAPASRLTDLRGPDDRRVPHLVELLSLFGIAADHPGTDPESFLAPEALARVGVLTHDCLGRIVSTFAPIAQRGLFTRDPLTAEPVATNVGQNASATAKAPSPILLFEGTDDRDVEPADVEAIRGRLCRLGQITDYLSLPGADHLSEIDRARNTIAAWIAARFAGRAAPDNCPTGRNLR